MILDHSLDNILKDKACNTESNTERKRLVLMRGLPSCGKSWTAERIATQGQGVVIEFNSFFEKEVDGKEGGIEFAWEQSKLPEARIRNFNRVQSEIDAGTSLIVVDDDHRLGTSAKALTAYAMLHGYLVEFAEPESSWWQTIKPLMQDKESNGTELAAWAQKLCFLSRNTHGVSLKTIVERMDDWQVDLIPLDLLSWDEFPDRERSNKAEVSA